jgi:hypothetical protein
MAMLLCFIGMLFNDTAKSEDYVALVINEGMNMEHWRNDTNHNPDDFKEMFLTISVFGF